MTGWLRDVRLVPVVLLATGSLFVLKTFGLVFDGGYSLSQRMGSDKLVVTTVPASQVAQLRSPAVPLELSATGQHKLSWMQEMYNYPGGDVTGSIHGGKAAEAKPAEGKPAEKKPEPAKPEAVSSNEKKPGNAAAGKGGVAVVLPVGAAEQRPVSPGERAVLERLQERRQELDARARELDLRESMLKAAEKKDAAQAAEAKAAGAQDGNPAGAATQSKSADKARLKAVVTMYEAMKPKDAAKIFDRLDMSVLLELATQMKPQVMSAVMAQMSPENAERLTVEMAALTPSDRPTDTSRLPKIDSRPGG